MRHKIVEFIGVNECLGTSKYLGLPLLARRSKKPIFWLLKGRVRDGK